MPIGACGQFQDFLFKSRGIQQSMAIRRIAAASLSAELAIHRAIAALDINNRAQFNDIAKICPAQSVRFLKKLPVGNGRGAENASILQIKASPSSNQTWRQCPGSLYPSGSSLCPGCNRF